MNSAQYVSFEAPGLAERIDDDLNTVASEVRKFLDSRYRALVLSGGYGRGEGGGIEVDGQWKPYNDYDLFVVVDGVNRFQLPGLRTQLAALGRSLEDDLGLEVELAPLRTEDLPHLPFTMMWCELLGAHRVIDGDMDSFACAPKLEPSKLPMFEGVHYLCNRAALILWSLVETLPPARVWKFVHKAWLAVGAAVLIAESRFSVGYTARLAALETLAVENGPGIPNLLEHYHEASIARVAPQEPPEDDCVLRARDEVADAILKTWRWFEQRRLGLELSDFGRYASAPDIKRDPVVSAPSNIVRHLRLLGRAGLRPCSILLEHPRTRVIRSLPALLAHEEDGAAVERLVGGGATWRERSNRWLDLWRKV